VQHDELCGLFVRPVGNKWFQCEYFAVGGDLDEPEAERVTDAEQRRLVPGRAHAGKQDRGADLALPEAGKVDADRTSAYLHAAADSGLPMRERGREWGIGLGTVSQEQVLLLERAIRIDRELLGLAVLADPPDTI